jgi:uncharacterized membrane protein YoaK (UPF0700 family)
MAYSGVEKLVFIDGIMDKILYVTILTNNLESFKMGINEYIYSQDNDSKHIVIFLEERTQSIIPAILIF